MGDASRCKNKEKHCKTCDKKLSSPTLKSYTATAMYFLLKMYSMTNNLIQNYTFIDFISE
jgi:hypothetical protein